MGLTRQGLLRPNSSLTINRAVGLCVFLASGVVVGEVVCPQCGMAAMGPIDTEKTLQVDGRERTYLLHIPARYDERKFLCRTPETMNAGFMLPRSAGPKVNLGFPLAATPRARKSQA